MTNVPNRGGLSWASRLLIALGLVFVGAAATAWTLARYDGAAQFLGVTPAPAREAAQPQQMLAPVRLMPEAEPPPPNDARLAELEARLRNVENSTQRVEGSAGRADGLLVAFAARRAVERGVALGYLEPLLVERFGASHPRAVSAIVSGARAPIRLSELISQYRQLGPELRSSAPDEGWWAEFKNELGSLISVRRADRPSTTPDARYRRSLEFLSEGSVDAALAETMRLPGATRVQEWTAKARRYIALQHALDEIETAALLGRMPENAS